MNAASVVLALGALGVGLVLGRAGTPAYGLSAAAPTLQAVAAQTRNDPREVIPLTPGSGQPPGSGPGQPGQSPGQGECTVLMFKDGQFYRMQPGTPAQNGTTPGGTGPNGNGLPGGDNELFPLQPLPQPAPLSPFPGGEERST